MDEPTSLYYKVIEHKMQSIGITSATYFPQFSEIFIPFALHNNSTLTHERIHKYFFCNAYGIIIQNFFQIIQNLKDHIIDRFKDVIDHVIDPNREIEAQILDIDKILSMNMNFVDIFSFYKKTYKKYKILMNSARMVQEGIACYFSCNFQNLSEKDCYYAKKAIAENGFYLISYKKIEQLKQKWDDLFIDILNTIFMVPFYNYDLIGMSLNEFVEISRFIHNPDKRFEFILNCSLKEENQIKSILTNKKDIVRDLKKAKGKDNIYHKFPTEMVDSAFMLKIHSIMGIETPNYKRFMENALIKTKSGEIKEYIDIAPDSYRSLEYIMIEHAAMHKQVEDIFRRLGVRKKPLHYDYVPSLSRDYFLFARAKDNQMWVDRLISTMQEEKDEELLTIESANELIDVDNFYLRTEAICKRWEDRLMTNTFEIWGKPSTLKSLETTLYLNDFIVLQSCSISGDDGYNGPEVIEDVAKIVVAMGGSTGVLLGIAKIIKALKIDVSIDLEKKKIDIKNITSEQAKKLFDDISSKMKEENIV